MPDLTVALASGTAGALLIDQLFERASHSGCIPSCGSASLSSLLLKAAPKQGWRRQFALRRAPRGERAWPSPCAALVGLVHCAAETPVVEVVLGSALPKASFALRELGTAAERVRLLRCARRPPVRTSSGFAHCAAGTLRQLDEEALLAGTI